MTARKSGTSTVSAKCGGKTAECVVTVTVPVSSITLDKTTLSLAVGESATLIATVKPDDAAHKTVTWSSSDESVASVDNGKVTAIKSGKAIVTAKCGGKTAECVVTVSVPVSSITLDKTALSLALGEFVTLIATVKPDDATDKTVVWYSSDESIAKVDNGKVTALKIGSATVTATAAGFSVSCKVTVIHPDNILYYTSTDGNIVKPLNESAFGANIMSNEYQDNVGKIVFDGPVTSIGNAAFYQVRTLKTITVPETVKQIGNSAFASSGLTLIDLKEGLQSLGSESFKKTPLLSITIPQTVKAIGESSFWECSDLKMVAMPENLVSIEDYTFFRCEDLVTIELPKYLKRIGYRAFEDSGLNAITLPETLEYIGNLAFAYTSLKQIQIPHSVTYFGSAFSHCGSLEYVNIYGTTTEISFSSCKKLTSIIIPEGVEKINLGAFSRCIALKTIIFPSTIKDLGKEGSYSECTILSEVYIKASIPPSQVLFDTVMDLNIYVPRASVDAYKEKWSAYKDNIKAYDF